MQEVTLPTYKEIWEEELGYPVYEDIDDSWRHGCDIYEVYYRKADDTYWGVSYQRSTDGNYNGLRENEATISRVYPHKVMTITYKDHPQDSKT